jgi:hypothetical protein
MRSTIAIAGALAALGWAAHADVAPEPPLEPIPEACKPLIGIWARTTPERTHWSENWDILVVDSQHATTVYWMNQKNVNIEAQTALFNIDCRPEDDGRMTVSMGSATDEEGSATMLIRLAGDSFTSEEVPYYDKPGPPPADWNPPPVQVTYKRIVP